MYEHYRNEYVVETFNLNEINILKCQTFVLPPGVQNLIHLIANEWIKINIFLYQRSYPLKESEIGCPTCERTI